MSGLNFQCFPIRTYTIQPKRKGECEHTETRSNIRESTPVAGESRSNNEEETDDFGGKSNSSPTAELGRWLAHTSKANVSREPRAVARWLHDLVRLLCRPQRKTFLPEHCWV